MSKAKLALCAAAAAFGVAAMPAQAAFVTYTFGFVGTGIYSYYDSDLDLHQDTLKGATITFGVNVPDDVGLALYSNGYLTDIALSATGRAFNFSFTPVPFQSSQFVTGGGTACLKNPVVALPTSTSDFDPTCGEISFSSSTMRSGLQFSGNLNSASVTRDAADGFGFFSVVGYVPEPSTWALMLAGFGMVGYALRRRPRLSYAT